MGNKSVVVIMGVLALLACTGPGMVWAQKGPVKLGVIAPMTGAAAANGKDIVNGLHLYLEQNGQQIAGRKVEVIVEDSQGKPDVALTKLRKLVENDKVQVLLGEVFAHIGYAMAPKVDEYKVPMLYPVIAADDLTQRKPAKWVVRTGWSSSQPNHPFGEDARLQARRDDRDRLRVRLGAGRRLPEDVRGKRRPDRPEALGAAQHHRL